MSKSFEKQLDQSVRLWVYSPDGFLLWVGDRFGDRIQLTRQQTGMARELMRLIHAKLKAFAVHYDRRIADLQASGEDPEKLERLLRDRSLHLGDILKLGAMTDSEREYAAKIGISVMAGQGVGKDFFSALVLLYFMDVFPYARGVCTGVSAQHLRNVLWAEVSKIMNLSKPLDPKNPQSQTILEAIFEWQTERIYHKGAKNPGARWFAEPITINENAPIDQQAKRIYGRHEDFMVVIGDEAAGIPDAALEPLEGTLTGKVNIAIMIFNPTRGRGYAYDTQHKHRGMWVCLRWNAEECPELVTPEHLAKMARHGRDTNTYRVKVLGLPPRSDDNSLIPWEWIEDAVGRELECTEYDPVMSAADVGGGGDKSVFLSRQGGLVNMPRFNSDKDTMAVADWVRMLGEEDEAAVTFIDIIGLGRGVYDKCRQDRAPVRPFDSRGTAQDSDRFFNSRAETYWKLREQFEHRLISIPNHEELKNELGAIKFDPDKKNKIADKKELRKALGHSPDIADALAMSYAKPDDLFRKVKRGKNPYNIDHSKYFSR